jgi:hypothetical protein
MPYFRSGSSSSWRSIAALPRHASPAAGAGLLPWADNRIGRSTAYRYLQEGIDVLAVAAPE